MTTDYRPTPGPELKQQRLAAGVAAKKMAAKLGVTYPSLWRLEQSPAVPVLRVRQYEDALRELVDGGAVA